MSYLTPEAKSKLSTTIRTLRERLLTDLQNAVEGTFRLSIQSLEKSGLTESNRIKRQRLEQWLGEQVRGEVAGKKLKDEQHQQIWVRQLRSLEKLAAATWLNRLVVIKQMEAMGLVKPAVVMGGWQSPAYREFREFAPELCKDETEGYGTLLQLLCDELALEMPGLFGKVSLTSLLPMPASTLRAVVEALDAPELKEIWLDDTTLGWVYQYWNDPEREGLDAKLNAGGKVEPHEIASKTQMFTERYMVEWLLQNSLGQLWLAMCQQNGWVAEAEADGTLARLEERRQAWRQKREAGEVALDALMPIETEQEVRWKYWVPQPLTEAAVELAPLTLWEFKLLDPACGSGHFLVIAVGLLFALYQEEARHLGEDRSERQIIESILENNLYGIDIDPRAVQIAAAVLYLKAKSFCKEASPKALNLVASNLQVAALPEDDLVLVELRHEIFEATGIPEALTNRIVQTLKGADQWGSLLKVDKEVDLALQEYELTVVSEVQKDWLNPAVAVQPLFDFEQAKASVLEKLEQFLESCTRGDDLGLRLRGEQLTAGVRFIRMVQEGSYDLVAGNPPYQGASELQDDAYLKQYYPKGKADLYAAFLERGLQLTRQGGTSALLTMRNWMFIKQFSKLREYLLGNFDLKLIQDLETGAFEEVSAAQVILSVAISIFHKSESNQVDSIAFRPVPGDLKSEGNTNRKRAAVLAQVGRFEFQSDRFSVIKEKPIIYWWDDEFLERYSSTSKIHEVSEVRAGLNTSSNERYIRFFWEVNQLNIALFKPNLDKLSLLPFRWFPTVMGAKSRAWIDPLTSVVSWQLNGLEMKVMHENRWGSHSKRVQNESKYFRPGVAFPKIGQTFIARSFRFTSIFNDAAPSVFPEDIAGVTCLLNSSLAREVMKALNPTVNFQVGDVNRLPLYPIDSADEIFIQLDRTFTEHEAAREPSVELKQPGSSCWNYAQDWAQQAVDRPSGKPLPDWNPAYEEPLPTSWISYALGVALGRFGANGEGILNEAPEIALPHGILYLSAYSRDQPDTKDSLSHPACQPLNAAWKKHNSSLPKAKNLHDWLRLKFFKDIHVGMYEQRPIYFPLSSSKKNFVAYISIHRWTDTTLPTLLAEYILPDLRQLEGELSDLMDSRNQGDKKQQSQAEGRYTKVQQLYTELKDFTELVQQCAEQGPLPAKASDIPRETDAPFSMDLDDGVMVNSAALWPLLEPQWTKPKTWWSQLSNAKGKKDYDWSHLAARYFPQRVDAKCQIAPSLAVAHRCFWNYHPAKAYEWELRLQDEIAPDFTIDEQDSNELRQQLETDHPDQVQALKEKEEKRRQKKYKKQAEAQLALKV